MRLQNLLSARQSENMAFSNGSQEETKFGDTTKLRLIRMLKEVLKIKKNAVSRTAFNNLIITYLSREDRIRTCDPYVPNVVRYRASLLPENRPIYRPNAKWVAKIHRFANLAKSLIGFRASTSDDRPRVIGLAG